MTDQLQRAYDDDNLRNPKAIDSQWAVNVDLRSKELGQTAKEFLGPKRRSLYTMWYRLNRQAVLDRRTAWWGA